MKLKKVLFTILLVLIAIILLQVNVKATGNVSEYLESEYDYFLTNSNKVLTKSELSDETNAEETIVAAIIGDYTGKIEKISGENTVKISNFTADALALHSDDYTLTYTLYIEGRNSARLAGKCGDYNITGDGLLYYHNRGEYVASTDKPYGEAELNTVINDFYDFSPNRIFYVGTYIGEMTTEADVDWRYVIIPDGASIDWDLIAKSLTFDLDFLALEIDNTESVNIPSKVFTELKKHSNTRLDIYRLDGSIETEFKGANIVNPNASFKTGLDIATEAKWDMVDTKIEDTIYMNFEHTGPVPGAITLLIYNEIFKDGDILKCYYYNETTKMYERVEDAKMISDYELQLNIDHCSKYVISKTELPAEIVTGNDSNVGVGAPDEDENDKKAEEQKKEEEKKDEIKEEVKKDETKAPGKIPHAGGTIAIIIAILGLTAIGTVAYIKNKSLKGI